MTETRGGAADRLLRRADDAQRRRPILAFPFAVLKKFGDDRAAQMAALIAYYGFFSLFPLLLVFVTLMAFVIQNDPALQERLLDSALTRFPMIGADIEENIGQITGSTFALVFGTVLALWSGTAVVTTAQWAMDDVWDVPRAERPALPMRVLRALLLLVALGVSIVVSAVLTGIDDGGSGVSGALIKMVSLLGTVLVSAAVFAFAYRVLTVARISWSDVIPGAIIAAVAWTVLLLLGSWIVDRYIGRGGRIYGDFAVVIGLLAWISLFAQIFLLAAEVNVVRVRRLWPRSLVERSPTAEDREVLADQAEEERAIPQERVDVRFGDREADR